MSLLGRCREQQLEESRHEISFHNHTSDLNGDTVDSILQSTVKHVFFVFSIRFALFSETFSMIRADWATTSHFTRAVRRFFVLSLRLELLQRVDFCGISGESFAHYPDKSSFNQTASESFYVRISPLFGLSTSDKGH